MAAADRSVLELHARHVDKPTHLVDGLAGMLVEQSSMITAGDRLVAVSFKPYTPETSDIVARVREAGGHMSDLKT